MIGAWLEHGTLRVRDDVPEPADAAGEAILRVRQAGICGTDLELLHGYRGFVGVPGHEFVGTVEQGPADWVGARVVPEINVTCRTLSPESACPPCATARPQHCFRREIIGILARNGGLAERVSVPVANLHRVPPGVSDDAAVFVEPLAAAWRVLEQLEPKEPERCLVLGPGRLGQLVARVLADRIPMLEVAGRPGPALDRAGKSGFATCSVDQIEASSYDAVVECTGAREGLEIAIRAVRPLGIVVLKSTHANVLEINISGVVVDEVQLIGSRCGPYAPALRALESGAVSVLDLVDDRWPLADVRRAFERAAEPGVAKVLVTP